MGSLPNRHAEMFFLENIFKPCDFYLKKINPVTVNGKLSLWFKHGDTRNGVSYVWTVSSVEQSDAESEGPNYMICWGEFKQKAVCILWLNCGL